MRRVGPITAEAHMTSILVVGFLLGLRHALEADHVAAVAALATGNAGLRGSVNAGIAWGLGHGLALLVIGVAVLTTGWSLPGSWAPVSEALVAIMLLALGLNMLSRPRSQRTRLDLPSTQRNLPRRALAVGLVHGISGSAALVILAAAAADSPASAVALLLVFGIAAGAGMAALSLMLAAAARYAGLRWTGAGGALHLIVVAVTLLLGSVLLVRAGLAAADAFAGLPP